MPLSRAFLSLGISSELRLFCSVIPTPQAQVVVGPVLVWWQRGPGARLVWESTAAKSVPALLPLLDFRGLCVVPQGCLKDNGRKA